MLIMGFQSLSVLRIVVYICQPQSPSLSHPLYPVGNHKFVLYVNDSISALQICSSVSFAYIPLTSGVTQYVFSLSNLLRLCDNL